MAYNNLLGAYEFHHSVMVPLLTTIKSCCGGITAEKRRYPAIRQRLLCDIILLAGIKQNTHWLCNECSAVPNGIG